MIRRWQQRQLLESKPGKGRRWGDRGGPLRCDEAAVESQCVFHQRKSSESRECRTTRRGGVVTNRQKIFSLGKSADEIKTSKWAADTHTHTPTSRPWISNSHYSVMWRTFILVFRTQSPHRHQHNMCDFNIDGQVTSTVLDFIYFLCHLKMILTLLFYTAFAVFLFFFYQLIIIIIMIIYEALIYVIRVCWMDQDSLLHTLVWTE